MSRDWTHLFLCLPPAASLCCSVDCPLEQSIGRQHHSSVISMETISSRGNDWAPSQSLLFCDRAMEAVLPTPSSQRHSPSYTHTHFSLRPLSSPLWRCNRDGIKKPVGFHRIWMKCFLTQQHQWGQTRSRRVNMPPTSSPYWENGDWSGDLLVRSSCFYSPSHVSSCLLFRMGLHALFWGCVG